MTVASLGSRGQKMFLPVSPVVFQGKNSGTYFPFLLLFLFPPSFGLFGGSLKGGVWREIQFSQLISLLVVADR